MDEPLLELDDVVVRHRLPRGEEVHAVERVSLQIRAGEVYGLVGESGCGKSTLARCAVALQRPVAGTVRFEARDVWRMSGSERRAAVSRRVGLVFQDPTSSLNPRLTVRDILGDPMRIHGLGGRREQQSAAAELAGLVGLPSVSLGRRPLELSGGQRQRVAIARAVALRPALLVADEPTSALDVSIQNQILNLLDRLRRELGLAILLISHKMHAVAYLADRIGVMYLGRLVEEGPVDDVLGAPLHPYTSALLSASPSLRAPSRRLILSGAVPSARRPPTGCPFRTRCWKATAECGEAFPAARERGERHVAFCIHPEPPLEAEADEVAGAAT
jgi:peptide/nickel transport system ATP-binding protein